MKTAIATKLFAIVLAHVEALATPTPSGVGSKSSITKSYDEVPFAPVNNDSIHHIVKCSSNESHKASMSHPASMLDCLGVSGTRNGMWVLKQTTDPNDDDDWLKLSEYSGCELLVRAAQPTYIGYKDVSALLERIHLSDGIRMGQIEEKGTFLGCNGNTDVAFWLRGV